MKNHRWNCIIGGKEPYTPSVFHKRNENSIHFPVRSISFSHSTVYIKAAMYSNRASHGVWILRRVNFCNTIAAHAGSKKKKIYWASQEIQDKAYNEEMNGFKHISNRVTALSMYGPKWCYNPRQSERMSTSASQFIGADRSTNDAYSGGWYMPCIINRGLTILTWLDRGRVWKRKSQPLTVYSVQADNPGWTSEIYTILGVEMIGNEPLDTAWPTLGL